MPKSINAERAQLAAIQHMCNGDKRDAAIMRAKAAWRVLRSSVDREALARAELIWSNHWCADAPARYR